MDVSMSFGIGVGLAGVIIFLIRPPVPATEAPEWTKSAGEVGSMSEKELSDALDDLKDEERILDATHKMRRFTHQTEDDVRTAIRSTKAELMDEKHIKSQGTEGAGGWRRQLRKSDLDEAEPSLVSIVESSLFLVGLAVLLYFWDKEQNGAVLHWAKNLFPKEMKALGL